MPSEPRVTVLSTEEILRRAIFRWVNIRFTFRRFDGTVSEPIERIVLDRGDSVGIVVHDLSSNTVILVEQLRIATLGQGSGWLLEIPAGTVEEGDTPEETALREMSEETGAPPVEIQLISSFFLSPGGSSELLHLFYAPYSGGLEVADHAGLVKEGEDIRVWRFPLAEALEMLDKKTVVDAKTIIGLSWLKGHTAR